MMELQYAVGNYFTVSELIDFEENILPNNYMRCFSLTQIKSFHNEIDKNKKMTTSKMMNLLVSKCLDRWQETNGSSFI